MAIVESKDKLTLKLELDAGIVEGRQRTANKSINNIKLDASNEGMYGTGLALTNLQNKDVLRIKKVEELTLTEE